MLLEPRATLLEPSAMPSEPSAITLDACAIPKETSARRAEVYVLYFRQAGMLAVPVVLVLFLFLLDDRGEFGDGFEDGVAGIDGVEDDAFLHLVGGGVEFFLERGFVAGGG